jgi:hypothetical protein
MRKWQSPPASKAATKRNPKLDPEPNTNTEKEPDEWVSVTTR